MAPSLFARYAGHYPLSYLRRALLLVKVCSCVGGWSQALVHDLCDLFMCVCNAGCLNCVSLARARRPAPPPQRIVGRRRVYPHVSCRISCRLAVRLAPGSL